MQWWPSIRGITELGPSMYNGKVTKRALKGDKRFFCFSFAQEKSVLDKDGNKFTKYTNHKDINTVLANVS